jgi:uncharacterized protein
MIHTVIVPGVAGSEAQHWQSWLQDQLMTCSRVQQNDWNHPVLHEWVAQFVATVRPIKADIQIVAHSFGCLTTMAALHMYPELSTKIKNVLLVAPANPVRFGDNGFARDSHNNYADFFQQLVPQAPTTMLISENDPWLQFDDAKQLAQSWQLQTINLGQVGHINVASGFGPFPQIFDYLISENAMSHINITDDGKHFFKFAI